MWRCYGYFLGIADEYNFCRGSFEEIKQRTQDFYQCWIIPNLRDITPEWEHMTRCIIESMNYYSLMCMSCKTIILLTTDILNLSMSHLHGSLSYLEWIAYKSWTYLSTILRILDWYNGQPWVKGTAACKNMEYAHRMHSLMRKKLCELDDEQIDNASKVAKPWCPDRELLLKDFALACPFEKSGQRPHIMLENLPMHKPKGLHSTSIAMTQCSFISTILLTPQKLGIHNATDEDLEAFCHMWRYYGYSLGLDDE
ncbi:hypothetical protein DMN91_013044 [Ooceraea biroi]|uniref:ER-bound oxygenase mpaB/mpaB'/Rubber oxygenase catalytic domain-containing protein n=1 Tax=Ooceraea biroi TaxID=2015173 RepID=A0A3L8D2E3_OOCBI|nr:hypothetical protein DMN91_013044 [Ooceraea biroi]